MSEVISVCKLILVNPATSESVERSLAQRLKTWFLSTITQERFTNLTILNSYKERTNMTNRPIRSLVYLANECFDCNDNRRRNFGIFKENNISQCLSFLMSYTVLLISILIDAPFIHRKVEYSRSKIIGFLVYFRAHLYGLGYPRQPFPRATLAELTFHLFL